MKIEPKLYFGWEITENCEIPNVFWDNSQKLKTPRNLHKKTIIF